VSRIATELHDQILALPPRRPRPTETHRLRHLECVEHKTRSQTIEPDEVVVHHQLPILLPAPLQHPRCVERGRHALPVQHHLLAQNLFHLLELLPLHSLKTGLQANGLAGEALAFETTLPVQLGRQRGVARKRVSEFVLVIGFSRHGFATGRGAGPARSPLRSLPADRGRSHPQPSIAGPIDPRTRISRASRARELRTCAGTWGARIVGGLSTIKPGLVSFLP
jgi:hypothetical protein